MRARFASTNEIVVRNYIFGIETLRALKESNICEF